VTGEDELSVVHGDVEHVTFSDPECMAEVGGEHHPSERVDAACSVLRGHIPFDRAKGDRAGDMASVL